MAKIDLEDALDSIESLLKMHLNTKIAEIENQKAAKGKGVKGGLKPVPNNAYYRQTWNQKILNHPVAIYFGIGGISPLDGGVDVAESLTIFIEVVFVDNGQTNDGDSRVFRYARAIKEVAKDRFGNLGFASRTTIEQVVPTSLVDVGTSDEVKIGGVQIKTSIA